MSALKLIGEPLKAHHVQVGGSHYKDMLIQPFEFITRNGIGYAEGCVIKYVSRWRRKGGVEDLKKAAHYLELLIESQDENQFQPAAPSSPAVRIQSPGWRYLNAGEALQEGDEYVSVTGEWFKTDPGHNERVKGEGDFRRRLEGGAQ